MNDPLCGFMSYLEYEKRYSLHTCSAYKVDLEQFLDFVNNDFGVEEMNAISDQMIRSWLASLMDEGLTARSINRKTSSVKSFFKYLSRQEIIKKNPSLKIQGPKQKKRLPIFIEESKMELVTDMEVDESSYVEYRDKLIVDLFYSTGIRRAELIGLTLNQIDLSLGQIKVLGKRNKERILPLLPHLLTSLKKYIALREKHFIVESKTEGLFLTEKGKKMYPKLVYRIVNTYLSTVSTQDKKSPHVLRHTFATHMLNNGADLNAVKELLGHASLAATQVYTHNTIEKLKKVYQQAHPKA
ncbi:tyrosine-type recombinase/integrase [Lentimicrobium sp. S6]|uniref:tyrosine-type recombinase/integrase n=1 Tax=Lentimicrobium sp. S6 TaxID=2735872 RepID=UPI001557E48B|nr:tyrosine-type recombinase/integrase [Lentimicrobium sp. S6]NPD44819.1 tyrosine-type recombinase/integrase [Lentimicrobium sp. S6]